MPLLPSHPHKHLIRDLWPDKHLYATTLLFLGAGIGGAFALVAHVVPVTFARDMPTSVAGWNWPFGIVLPLIALPLAYAAYRTRRPWLGFLAATVEFVSFGALAIVTLIAAVAMVFLFVARWEGEHTNPATKDLHAHHWPDKSLAAALLFVVAGVASAVWGAMLVAGQIDVRSYDLTLWGVLALAAGVCALIAAALCYWQRSYAACLGAALAVALSFGFVLVGPALGIGAAALLLRARHEGEFR